VGDDPLLEKEGENKKKRSEDEEFETLTRDSMAEDMSKMLGRLQELQEQMGRAQDEVGALVTTAESGGGVVKVTASGKLQILKIEIAKEIIDPNEGEMLEDLVVAAVNRAIDHARELGESKMAEVTRSLLPPGFPPIV